MNLSGLSYRLFKNLSWILPEIFQRIVQEFLRNLLPFSHDKTLSWIIGFSHQLMISRTLQVSPRTIHDSLIVSQDNSYFIHCSTISHDCPRILMIVHGLFMNPIYSSSHLLILHLMTSSILVFPSSSRTIHDSFRIVKDSHRFYQIISRFFITSIHPL